MEQVLTDGKICKAKIIESIRLAKKTIKIAMAFFTDREIANELLFAKENGIDVSLILSSDANNESIKELLKNKIQVTTFESKGTGIMHHKFCIIDNSLLLHGSYNYTYNALNNNQESLNLTNSMSLIDEYSAIFNKLLRDVELYNDKLTILPMTAPIEEDNYLEKFNEQLKNHISRIFDDFNQDEIVEEGRKISKENDGQESVFLAYLDSSLSRVNNRLNQDDHTRSIVKTSMTVSLDRAIETNNSDLESDLNLLEDHSNSKKSIISQQIETSKSRKKEKQEEFNIENAEAAKIRSNVAELNDEIDSLDRQIVVTNFWTFPTVFKLFITSLLFLYLSFFFSSAIWKILFEEVEVLKLLSKGITPDVPPLLDANALTKVFTKQGLAYGLIAALFFIIPVLLTSIKLFAKKNRFIEIFIGWIVGVFVIDIVVAILISQHTFEIQRMLVGGSEKWQLLDALSTGDFWLIFIFGALPLFITKNLIENIWTAYNKSSSESVDREKTLLRNSNKRKLSEQEHELNIFKIKLDNIQDDIKDLNGIIIKYEDDKNEINTQENDKKFELKERNEKRNKNLRDVFNAFIASVDSGNKQFLQNVVSGRITAFKQGYFSHIISYYSQIQSQMRTENLEAAHKNWINSNFE